MDYEDMESELEMAGIDPFEFSLMDEDERREVLEDNYLDPWDFEDFDLEYPGGYSYTPPVAPVTPKPPVTESSPPPSRPAPMVSPRVPVKPEPSPIVTRPAVDLSTKEIKGNIYSSHRICIVRIPGVHKIDCYLVNGLDLNPGDTVEVPVGATRNPVAATVVSLTYGNAPDNQAVIRKLPDYAPDRYTPPEQIRNHRQQAEIAKIDRKMSQLRHVMIVLVSLLVIIVVAGSWTANHPPVSSVPIYSINPTTEIVRLPSPTPRSTPKATSTPMPTAPYVGMYVSYVPSKWTWQGTDNLTVKDAAGNKIRTIKYHYEVLPKQYTIWVSEATSTVVKVSVTDPTAPSKKTSSKKKKSSDPYGAKDYAHPDDFYYDYYDDFWDYEDAEDYWEEYN